MDYGTMALWVLSVGVIGGAFTYWYGKASYDNGFVDAIDLHSTGELTYTVIEDEYGKSLEIRIKNEE